MKQRLHDLTAQIIDDEWAVSCEFYVRRELAAAQVGADAWSCKASKTGPLKGHSAPTA
eukprot:SAG22_NODE_5044_length_1101_cov_1.889222_2_plen_58_part_00